MYQEVARQQVLQWLEVKSTDSVCLGSNSSFVTKQDGTWKDYFSLTKPEFPYLKSGDKTYVIAKLSLKKTHEQLSYQDVAKVSDDWR